MERDGVLNSAKSGPNCQIGPTTLEEFHIHSHALEPLQELKAAGFLLIVTSNQPGLSRGYQSRSELDMMHSIMRQKLPVDDFFICPHDEMDRCPCRKPKAGLLFEAAFKWHLDLDRCFVISDKWHDAQAAHLAGCTSLLIDSPWIGRGHQDFVLPDLASAVRKAIQLQTQLTAVRA